MAQWKDRPAYQEVADDLRRRIHDQEFPVGAKLPSHAELMREYNVSVTVVRMALDDLGSDGLIRSQQGKGTFIHATPETGEPERSAAFLALQEQLIAIANHLSQIDERLDALEHPRRHETA
jgi:DNA-binding GntR family transcriptional regulator